MSIVKPLNVILLQGNPTWSISPVDRFPIRKVGLSVKRCLSYCQKYDRETRVIRRAAAFASIDHLLKEIIFYVCVLRLAPLYSRVYVDENRLWLRYPCHRHILYLKRPQPLITEWSKSVPQWLWSIRCTLTKVQHMLQNHCSALRMPEHSFSHQ